MEKTFNFLIFLFDNFNPDSVQMGAPFKLPVPTTAVQLRLGKLSQTWSILSGVKKTRTSDTFLDPHLFKRMVNCLSSPAAISDRKSYTPPLSPTTNKNNHLFSTFSCFSHVFPYWPLSLPSYFILSRCSDATFCLFLIFSFIVCQFYLINFL